MNPLKKKKKGRISCYFLRWSEVFLTARVPRRGPVGRAAGQEGGGSPDGTVRPGPGTSQKGRATSGAGRPVVSVAEPGLPGGEQPTPRCRVLPPQGAAGGGIPTEGHGPPPPFPFARLRPLRAHGRFPPLLTGLPCFTWAATRLGRRRTAWKVTGLMLNVVVGFFFTPLEA